MRRFFFWQRRVDRVIFDGFNKALVLENRLRSDHQWKGVFRSCDTIRWEISGIKILLTEYADTRILLDLSEDGGTLTRETREKYSGKWKLCRIFGTFVLFYRICIVTLTTACITLPKSWRYSIEFRRVRKGEQVTRKRIDQSAILVPKNEGSPIIVKCHMKRSTLQSNSVKRTLIHIIYHQVNCK